MGRRAARWEAISVRQAAHFLLNILAFLPWAVANALYALAALLIVGAYKVLPDSKYGSCWSYAIPRWLLYGGYLVVRPAHGVRFLKVLMIPHVLWMPETPDAEMLQFVPLQRRKASIVPGFTVYFSGYIKTRDSKHRSRPEAPSKT